MKILFVDDEPRVLGGIENALLFAPDGWEATFAHSGEEAMELLDEADYDVLVTDMQMPGATGADVLERARTVRPHTVRIVLSGEANPDLAQRAMPLAAEFVSKPCAPDDLFEIIERAHAAALSVSDVRCRELLLSTDTLPANPALNLEIQRCLERGDGIDAIAAAVEADLATATLAVKMANSAFFGYASPAETVLDAAVRLGASTLSGLVLRAAAEKWADPGDLSLAVGLNQYSIDISLAVDHLVGKEVRQARLAGLLHDIGRLLLLARLPEESRRINAEVGRSDPDGGTDLERELIGITHCELGGHLLGWWKADPIVVDVVRYHHDPERADGDARRIIDAVNAARTALIENDDAEPPPEVDWRLLARAREALGR